MACKKHYINPKLHDSPVKLRPFLFPFGSFPNVRFQNCMFLPLTNLTSFQLSIHGHRGLGGWHPLEAVRGLTPPGVSENQTLPHDPLFLVKKYPKIIKNSIFLLNFDQKISKFSQNFTTNCVFRQNARKINAWFIFWKTC